jgi:hypothetical protein
MPIKTVVNKKYLIQQLLILLPLSLSGIFLVTQAISSRSDGSDNAAVQSAPAASQRTASPAGRAANPSGGTSNRTPLEDPEPPGAPGDPGAAAVPVDGGLGLLLAAGVGYGVKRMYKGRQKKD